MFLRLDWKGSPGALLQTLGVYVENGLNASGAGHVRVQVAPIWRRDHPLGGALVAAMG
jgi:hypothetical protein